MAWLFLLAAILGLICPPAGVVVLGMMVLGVFAKGVVADSQEPMVCVGRKNRQRHGAERPQDAVRRHVTEPQPGKVIDARCYPILPPLRLPRPMPKSLDRLR